MSSNKSIYNCIRCNRYETTIFTDMKKHCTRKRPCIKRNDVILMSEDQILVMTLIPYIDNIHQVSIDELNHLSKSNIMLKNKLELFEYLEYIKKYTLKVCKYCKCEFENIFLLRKHVIITCFFNYLKKTSSDNNTNNTNLTVTDSNTVIIGDNNTINNINNINNNNNNYNLFFNLPVPFEEDWDLSEISKSEREGIITSQFVFSRFLNEVLKNNKNLNVIIKDDGSNTSLVYMNHKNQYISMDKSKLLSLTMDKIHDQLHDVIDYNTETLKIIKECSKDYINFKFKQYVNDINAKSEINEVIIGSFISSYISAEDMYNKIQEMNDKKIILNKTISTKHNKKHEILETKNDRTFATDLLKLRADDFYYMYDSDGITKI